MTVLPFPAAASRPALARMLAITARAWRLSAPSNLRHLPLPLGPTAWSAPPSRRGAPRSTHRAIGQS